MSNEKKSKREIRRMWTIRIIAGVLAALMTLSVTFLLIQILGAK